MMDDSVRTKIEAAWRELPDEVREAPASQAGLEAFEAEFGPIPADFRWFLSVCGGGPCGPEWVDGIPRLATSHRKYRAEWGPPRGWSMTEVFIIGWDGGGNPFGIHVPSGRILVEDHAFGGIHEMATSLEEFLARGAF